MSDLKRSCPACESWTSSIGAAFRDGDPCPVCGLPADAALAFDAAVTRGADEKLAERMVRAERELATEREEVARLGAILSQIRSTLDD